MSASRRGLLIPLAFVLGGLAVLLSLGTWQLERLAWKEGLIAALTQRLAAAPVDLPTPAAWRDLKPDNDEFRRVRLRVEFRDRDALVYTSGSPLRDDVKSPGYFAFAVGRLPGGEQVVINRGYVKDRNYPASTGAGPQDIVGYLRWPEPSPWFVADYDASADTWYVRDHRLMAKLRGWGDIAPFYIEQEAPVPPGGAPHPATLRVSLPNHHLQYALTWYGLALVLVAVFAVWLTQRRARPEPGTEPGR